MDIVVTPYDAAYITVSCEPGIAFELSDYFTFKVPGYQHMPKFKNKVWDGNIRLFNTMSRRLYAGLLSQVVQFAKDRDYSIEVDPSFAENELSVVEANEFLASLKLPPELEIRDYQLNAFIHAIRRKRAVLVSSTGSGKSLIIYTILRRLGLKTLIVVPTIGLVHQMAGDFKDYGLDSDKYVNKIYAGQEKQTDCPITITTWQSAYEQPKQWFDQFSVVFGDEAHTFKSKSLIKIMENLTKCQYRFGLTGTLDDSLTHKLVLEGLFGPVEVVSETADLIARGYLSKLRIKMIVLQHQDEERRELFRRVDGKRVHDYEYEIKSIISNDARNRFIVNLALSLKGNTLILYRFVDLHGKLLYDKIVAGRPDGTNFFIHRDVPGARRDEIRALIEQSDESITTASYGTFSLGSNVKRIHNVILASPSDSKTRVLQSLGRGLRPAADKEVLTLYDIADDISWKSNKNDTLRHASNRLLMYDQEKHDYKIYNVELKG